MTPPLKHCEYCGAEFVPNHNGRQRFCSPKNGDKYSACYRAWDNENKHATRQGYHFTCKGCGKEYHTYYPDRDQYCSRECAFQNPEGWHHAILNDVAEYIECAVCHQRKKKRYAFKFGSQFCCSKKCHYQISLRECLICGHQFKAYNARQRICNNRECQLELGRRNYYKKFESAAQPKLNTCEVCGKRYLTKTSRNNKYCSRACYKKSEIYSQGKARMRHQRRARERGREYEEFNPIEIFKRDNWICGICGKPTDRRTKWPHKNYPVLDHIIPLARGGEHTRRNCQCAHNKCNSVKSANILVAQMRLFG